MLRRNFLLASLCVAVSALTGCSAYKITSDSIAESNLEATITGRKVLIQPMDANVNTTDMLFRSTAQAVSEVFLKHGVQIVSSAEEPHDYIARVAYGLADGGSGVATSIVPIYGQTSSTTFLPGGGMARTTGIGQVGSFATSSNYKVYHRWFSLSLTTVDSATEIWRTDMRSDGTSNSFLAVLPSFMKTLDSRFAQNSDGKDDWW